MSAREDRAIDLLDWFTRQLGGVTITDIMDDFGWDHPTVNETLHAARLFLADEPYNIVCSPDPGNPSGRWLYDLTGDAEASRPWVTNRIGDAESRFRTMSSVMASIVKATDGRSIEGRKARVMERALNRLIEDLDLILDDRR